MTGGTRTRALIALRGADKAGAMHHIANPSYARQLGILSDECSKAPRFIVSVVKAVSFEQSRSATAVMEKDTLLPLAFPAVARKKVSVAFDGEMLSSDGGVVLARNMERQLWIAQRL